MMSEFPFHIKIPKGQVTSLSIFFFSAYFGYLSFSSDSVVKEYVFMAISIILIFFGMVVYSGGIICKERLSRGDE